jgi:hypothetical protein
MPTVIKLGGCNGSGKTSVAKAVMDLAEVMPFRWTGNRKSPNFYDGQWQGRPVVVLGSYESACGGMDTISDKDERVAMIKWAIENIDDNGIVFFEGLMTGKTYGALGAMSEVHKAMGTPWLYAFLDTPFEVCVERVLTRRKAAGNHEPFDPERTMRSTFDSCLHLREKLQGERVGRTPIPTDHPVMVLKHNQKPAALARQLLTRAEKL